MSTRSLNKVMLIGNLTRDPELKYTPSGTGVCTFGLATNREWTDSSGQKQEGAEFHRIVAWGKLGELCSQLLTKGRKIYVEGRLQTRAWKSQDGADRQVTEVVIEEMILLDSPKGDRDGGYEPRYTAESSVSPLADVNPAEEVFNPTADVEEEKPAKKTKKEDKAEEDEIPF
ncbi:MAG TPA: single-stranded DNA-binding protein [Candidatus Woesebacteria bacterium]|nr:single-stranded DNA-binding protein [Candidatus Woesebacteria bacterium]